MRNLKSTEALKTFRTLNHKCFDVGTKALLDSEKGCEHLKGELQLKASMTEEQKDYLFRHGTEARRVSLDLGTLTKESVEDIGKIILHGLKMMDVLILQYTPVQLENAVDDPTLLFQETGSLPNLRSVHLPLLNHIADDYDGFRYERFRYILMPELLRRLLQVACNLEEIHNVYEDLFLLMNILKMTDAVKSVCISDSLIWEEDEEDGEQGHDPRIVAFARASPKLIKLSVHEFHIQNSYVKAIVKSSREILRKIKIPYDGLWVPGEEIMEEFPVLPLISSADFFTVFKLHQYIGAEQVALSFPNLRRVRVNADCWRYFQEFSTIRRMFPAARSLFINFDPGTAERALMDRLMKMFPSVKSVTINWQEFSKSWTTHGNHLMYGVAFLRKSDAYVCTTSTFKNMIITG